MKKKYVIETNIDYNIHKKDWNIQVYDNNINRNVFYTNNTGFTTVLVYDGAINEYRTNIKYLDGSLGSSVSERRSHFTGL
jgi:hypothetical protein